MGVSPTPGHDGFSTVGVMDARPLRDLLADLVGDAGAREAYGADPAGYLAAHGHAELPSELVSEAVVAYADTAPVEVASLLAPYVAGHGPVPGDSVQGDWFELLTSAEPVGVDAFGEELDSAAPAGEWSDPGELDFGAGAGVAVEDVVPVSEVDEPAPEWSGDDAVVAEPPIAGLPVEELSDDVVDEDDEFE